MIVVLVLIAGCGADKTVTSAARTPRGVADRAWLAAVAAHGLSFRSVSPEKRTGVLSPKQAAAAAIRADAGSVPTARAAAYLGRTPDANGLTYLVRITGVKEVAVGGACKVSSHRPHRCSSFSEPKPNHEVNALIDARSGKFISDLSFR